MTAFKAFFAATFVAACTIPAVADIQIDGNGWALSGEKATVTRHLGQASITLSSRDAVARLVGADFHNGTIEFDISLEEKFGFPGLYFRTRDGGDAEVFYLRPDVVGKFHANQYNPSFNGLFAWQMYTGPRFGAPVRYKYGDWSHIKLVVSGTKMDVYIDSEEPLLHIPNLAHGDSRGGIEIHGSNDTYHIANVKVSHDETVRTIGTAEPYPASPKGLLTEFQVSRTPIPAKLIEAHAELPNSLMEDQAWQPLAVNDLGMANLARAATKTRDLNTLLVRKTITADEAKNIRLQYGYSDRVTIFLNGRALAHNDASFMKRDGDFYGTVGLFDSTFLPLRKGENELVFAVSESFGGWAIMAAIEDQSGLFIE